MHVHVRSRNPRYSMSAPCRCGHLHREAAELRERVHAAEAAARSSEETAAAQQERLAAWVDRHERTARRHAEVYQRLRSAHAVDRGASALTPKIGPFPATRSTSIRKHSIIMLALAPTSCLC